MGFKFEKIPYSSKICVAVSSEIITTRIREIQKSLSDKIEEIVTENDTTADSNHIQILEQQLEDINFEIEKAIENKAEEIASDLISDQIIYEIKNIINDNPCMMDFTNTVYTKIQNMIDMHKHSVILSKLDNEEYQKQYNTSQDTTNQQNVIQFDEHHNRYSEFSTEHEIRNSIVTYLRDVQSGYGQSL